MPKTLDEIRREGLAVLEKKLGKAGMVRFLQVFDAGHGDYATERHEWVDRTSLADLKEKVAARRRSKRRVRRDAR